MPFLKFSVKISDKLPQKCLWGLIRLKIILKYQEFYLNIDILPTFWGQISLVLSSVL